MLRVFLLLLARAVMVSARVKEREAARASGAMSSSERPKQLHNFALPYLRWSNQKHLRCVKVGSPGPSVLDDGGHSGGRSLKVAIRRIESDAGAAQAPGKPVGVVLGPRSGGGGGDAGIGGQREKRRVSDELGVEREEGSGVLAENKEAPEQEPGAAAVPWNLRTRRLGYKALAAVYGGAKAGDSPSRSEGVDVVGSGSGGGGNGGKSEERDKFAVPLKRKEIEEDFMAMTGHRPPRRPKKRNRTVQKNLDVSGCLDCFGCLTIELHSLPLFLLIAM